MDLYQLRAIDMSSQRRLTRLFTIFEISLLYIDTYPVQWMLLHILTRCPLQLVVVWDGREVYKHESRYKRLTERRVCCWKRGIGNLGLS